MTANNCPSCFTPYDHCTCGPGGATRKGPVKLTGRAVFRAAVAMQRAGLPFANGAEHVEGREMSTGRMDNTPYVKADTLEYQRMKQAGYRKRKR